VFKSISNDDFTLQQVLTSLKCFVSWKIPCPACITLLRIPKVEPTVTKSIALYIGVLQYAG